ncbi:hypothetical protein D910_00433 [Dendroctonus ponderosae]|uniref:Helicase associated domain-containing protein n=1 Tax=Dendroctonus ponderosae TaxID=77166 RepID=U4UZL4_DENPD|nr:hypothetical protein D910_00433 [Dendroctonus ponderosae]
MTLLQVHDGRDAAARVPDGSGPKRLRRGDAGRGARAHHPYRRALRPAEAGRHQAARAQADRHLRHAGRRQVLPVLLRGAHLHHPRAHLPGGGPLHQGAGDGLPGRQPDHSDADPPARAARRHPAVPHRAGGDRHRLRDPLRAHEVAGAGGARADHSARLLGAALRNADAHLRPGAARQPQSGDRHQYSRNVAHDRRHLLRGRSRLRQAEGLQLEDGHGLAGGHAHLAGAGQTEGGPRRPHRPRQVLPPLHRARLPRRDAPHSGARDPAHQSGNDGERHLFVKRRTCKPSVLQLKTMGINDLLHFDFMDAPPVESLIMALEQLHSLSALDDEGLLTRLGRRVSSLTLTQQFFAFFTELSSAFWRPYNQFTPV